MTAYPPIFDNDPSSPSDAAIGTSSASIGRVGDSRMEYQLLNFHPNKIQWRMMQLSPGRAHWKGGLPARSPSRTASKDSPTKLSTNGSWTSSNHRRARSPELVCGEKDLQDCLMKGCSGSGLPDWLGILSSRESSTSGVSQAPAQFFKSNSGWEHGSSTPSGRKFCSRIYEKRRKTSVARRSSSHCPIPSFRCMFQVTLDSWPSDDRSELWNLQQLRNEEKIWQHLRVPSPPTMHFTDAGMKSGPSSGRHSRCSAAWTPSVKASR